MFEPKATAPHLDSTATTFVVTRSPPRSNRRDGFSFSGESATGRRNRSGCVRRYQDGWTSALDRTIQRTCSLAHSQPKSGGTGFLLRRIVV